MFSSAVVAGTEIIEWIVDEVLESVLVGAYRRA